MPWLLPSADKRLDFSLSQKSFLLPCPAIQRHHQPKASDHERRLRDFSIFGVARSLSKNLFTASLTCLLLTLAYCGAALAQNGPGQIDVRPYAPVEGGLLDSVSDLNGSLMLHIPLISYPQRASQQLAMLKPGTGLPLQDAL